MSIIALTICEKKHEFREIESDFKGRPVKYKCVACNMVYTVKKDIKATDYLDKKNNINNRIAENQQKIRLIEFRTVGGNERIHINHLQREITTLNKLIKKY